jgi:F-type H+-transporting ATPase subunit gamma
MDTLESLRRQMKSTETLESVVRTMEALSMTSIHQCEAAVASLSDYTRTVHLGLQAALRQRGDGGILPVEPGARTGAVVFGSAWGLCGRFNEQVAAFAAEQVGARPEGPRRVLALGQLVEGRLADHGHVPDRVLAPPTAVEQITARVSDLLGEVERWRETERIQTVRLFFNETTGPTSFAPTQQRLLPLDRHWLERLTARPWPTRMIPLVRMDWAPLFAALVRQYLFVSLYRAFAESLASEHSSRLAAMQAAQNTAEERLRDLRRRYHQRRQSAITEELLDITAGVEALSDDSLRTPELS